EAVKIATDLAEALDYAHRHEVIHRDIKPANILMHEGRPLIADFGIALAVGAAGAGRLTETGLSLGTPFYMSPEQATGDQFVGPATDTYALGAVLYEMLIGDPPYMGSTAQAVLGQIIAGEAVSATKKRASVPANVDAALRCALDKLPADRFKSAQDFGKALEDEHFRHGELAEAGGGAVAAGPWNRLSVTTTAVAAMFALAFGWALLRPEASAPLARFSSPFEEGQAPIGRVQLTTDGSSLVYVGPGASGQGRQLWIRRWADLDATPIRGTEGAATFALSPDGREVAFAPLPGPLRVVALDGGPGRTLLESVGPVSDWTPDGDVYFSVSGTLSRVPATGGGSEAVEIVTELREGETIHRGLSVLPGGKMGVFQVWYAQNGEDAEVWAIDLDTRERRFLVAGNSPSYASTGHLLFGTPDGVLMAAPFDPSTAELTGPSVPVAEGLTIVPPFGLVTYSVSEDGTLIYVKGEAGARSGGQQMWVMDLEGNVEDLLLAPRQIASVGWSPDGESVVYASDGQIYTYNVVLNSVPTQLTFEGINQNPVFSPDRTRVAFSSVREGTDGLDLFVKDLDPDSAPRSIITLEANQFLTQWPSDSLIVFEQRAGGNTNLWTVDLSDPDNPRAEDYLTSESDLRYMVVSPDGTLAAYRSNESGQNEIYIRSFPEAGAQTIVSQGGGDVPFWSPDGNTLYYFTGLGRPLIAARLQRAPVPVVLSRDTLVAADFSSVRPFQGSGLHPEGDRFILAGDVGSGDAAAEPNQIILVQNWFTELRERMGGN
ncbi:MAG: serine/threonine-protein kinase, partial [Gemmatimonadetes bacterium]|nr:serine/threonine-protein kinase [Gemmatimonadota bacterium]